jgi:hypothetical protein
VGIHVYVSGTTGDFTSNALQYPIRTLNAQLCGSGLCKGRKKEEVKERRSWGTKTRWKERKRKKGKDNNKKGKWKTARK